MNKPLTLVDAVNLMKTLPLSDASMNEDLNDFIGRVEEAGKTLMKEKGMDYLDDVAAFLMSAVMAECLSNPNKVNVQIFHAMSSRSDVFQLIFGYAFIYAVGLCAVEELR